MTRQLQKLLLLVVAAVFASSGYAASDVQIDGILYRVANGDAGIISASCSGNAIIPSQITYRGNTYPVTGIASGAFNNCSELVSITIPSSVTFISRGAFGGNNKTKNLIAINVSDDNPKYSSIDGVLYDKEQKVLIFYPRGGYDSFVIPSSVTSIGEGAFSGCN